MKKILFISQYLNRAGTEAFMMSVFRGVDHACFHVDFLLYSKQDTDYTREVEAAGSKVYRVPSRKESYWKWQRALDQFFKEHSGEYDAVHFCGNSLTTIAPLWYAYKYCVPIRICHAHNSSCRGLHNKVLHLMKRGLAKRICTHYMACSTLAAKWFFGDAEAQIVANGIPVEQYRYNEAIRRKKRQELGIAPEERVVGHVGRFVMEKNHEFMLEVFAQCMRMTSPTSLLLVGTGPLMQKVRQKADELGVTDHVRFLGERSDVPELLQAMDVFFMPSLFEGLPYVLIEAQGAGLPCVISDVINKDIVLTPSVYYASLEETKESWAEKLVEVLKKKKDRPDSTAWLAKAGYSVSDTLRQLEQIYASKS